MKKKQAVAETEIGAAEDVDADLHDHQEGTIEPLENTPDSFLGRLAYAKKAVVAAVGTIATVAITLGWGDEQLWAQIVAVVGTILTIVGVFTVTNDDA
jgi:hypothetical protein